MVVGYTDVNDGCADGSADRTDPEDKEDSLKIELKDFETCPKDIAIKLKNDVPAKILDICSRTTADKDKTVETTVDIVSSGDETTSECDSSSEEDNNALETVGNNHNNHMVNKLTDCKEFLVAKNVQIINNYPQQPLDVEQLKYITDGSTTTKWIDEIHPGESIEKKQKKVACPFGKAVAIGVTVTLITVIFFVGIEVWQLKSPAAERNKDDSNNYDHDATIFGPTAPPNITLVTRQSCGLKDPTVYDMANITVMPPNFVIISHTVTAECFTQRDCCERVRNVQANHLAQGWTDIGFHFLVGGDGNVYEGRQWYKYGSFLLHFNCMSYGVSFIGSFEVETPRRKQVLAAEKLLHDLKTFSYLPKNYTVYGAMQLQGTESPGVTVMKEIEKWPHWSSEVEDKKPCPLKT